MNAKSFVVLVLAVLTFACGDDGMTADTGTLDSATGDTGTPDSTVVDSSTPDSTADTGTMDGSTDSSTADGSTDGASDGAADGGVVTFCMGAGGCDSGEMCYQANITCGSEMGFCVSTEAETCGGIAGLMCPSGQQCVMEDPTCGGADLTGVCVTPAERAAICAMQPDLWSC
jgi:hypothetical protein